MISYSNRLRTTIFPVKSNIFGIPELTSHFQTIIYEKNVLCSIKGMRDNIDHSQTFTCIIWMFKNFFFRKCLFMVCTGYEGCDHCRKYKTTPFNLVTVQFKLYICYRNIIWWKYPLHVLNVYVNKVVKEHPTKVILEDAVFILLT